jgi:hypothetical protein
MTTRSRPRLASFLFAAAAAAAAAAAGSACGSACVPATSLSTGGSDAGNVSDAALGDASEQTDVDSGLEGKDPGLGNVGADASPPPAGTGFAVLLAEANRELAAMRASTYTHVTSVDEPSGTFDYDCSGFIDYALARVLPDAYVTLRAATTTRPVASSYESFFESAAADAGASRGRFRRVARVSDLVPGDIVAWLKPPALTSTNTGHVMIVHGAVQARGANEWLVPVIDSTSSPHGTSDSRSASGATGLGTGSMVLVVDLAGAPLQYRWSTWSGSAPYSTPIALGHID